MEHQQIGPSVHPDSVIVNKEEWERVQRELVELKNAQNSRSRSSSTVSRVSLGMLQADPSINGTKMLSAINGMALPEGGKWKGLADTRSVRRFMASVISVCRLSNLDHKGAFNYLTTRCLEAALAEEVLDRCSALNSAVVDYALACCEVEKYMNTRFEITNRTDKFIAKFGSKSWCKDAANVDEYIQAYELMLKEAFLLGISFDEDMKRYYFMNGLPDAVADRVRDRYDLDLSVSVLQAKIVLWLENTGDNPFQHTARKAVVRAVEDRTKKCYGCGQAGHFKRDCPGNKQTRVAAENAKEDAEPEQLRWVTSVIAQSGLQNAVAKVQISSARDGNHSLEEEALLDSGASKTVCSRKFADKMFKSQMVRQSDITPGKVPELVFGDKTVVKPLGTVPLVIEGNRVDVIVVNDLCCDLIVGMDQLSCNPVVLHRLVGLIKGCSEAEAARLCTVELRQEEQKESEHCDWPPVELKWKADAVESIKSNVKQAKAEALQLERRMAKKSPELLEAYQEVLSSWISNGWLVQVEPAHVKFCLRHFPVAKDVNGTTAMQKCRVVVDGSRLTALLDVKDCTHTDITGNLLMWRTCDVFTCMDISQAYMRVGIAEADSFYLCIAWRNVIYRFTSLPMGISPSAQALQEAVDAFIQQWETSYRIQEVDIKVVPYMDDLIQMIWAKDFCVDLAKVEGGARESLEKFLREKGMKTSVPKTWGTMSTDKVVLGTRYSLDNIGVRCKLAKLSRGKIQEAIEKGLTRRDAVSWIGTPYDPMGLLAEIMMQGRLLVSQFSGLAWDKLLPSSLNVAVGKWVDVLLQGIRLSFPRKLDCSMLFVFTDASAVGTSVIIYARDSDGNWKRLFGKGKVYSKHQRGWVGTSSKIELVALQMGVHVMQYLQKVLVKVPKLSNITWYIATDSEVNLNRFYGNIASIQDKWEKRAFIEVNNALVNLNATVYHIPGKMNPADSLSRGLWLSDSDSGNEAVSWYNEERAVRPVKCPKMIVEEPAESTCESTACEKEYMLPMMDVEELISDTVSLNERYASECADGSKTRQQWMLEYQSADEVVAGMIRQNKAILHNGVYVVKYRQDPDGFSLYPVVIPSTFIQNALVSVHDREGHFGYRKTLAKARDMFFWKNMAAGIKKYCMYCSTCQRVKGSREWNTPAGNVYVEGKTWSVVGIDTVKGTPKPILTVTDMYTRYVFTFALKRETTQNIMLCLDKLWATEGAPAILVSDNASMFVNKEFKAFLILWGICGKLIPRYAPWYGGFYEAGHKALVKTLIALLDGQIKGWENHLVAATMHYNSKVYEFAGESGLTPHEVFRGRKSVSMWSRTLMNVDDPTPAERQVIDAVKSISEDRSRVVEMFEEIWKRMRSVAQREVDKRCKKPVVIEVGEFVYVWVQRLNRGKLDPQWIGPFRVEQKLSSVTFMVNGTVEHAYNLKKANVIAEPSESGSSSSGNMRRRKRARLSMILALEPKGELLLI